MMEVAAEKAGIAKRGAPLVTQLYPSNVAARIGEIAHDAGAIWEPRGLHWDALVRPGKLKYRDRQGELDLPLPRLPGKHQALNAAGGGHASASVGHRGSSVGTRRGDGLGELAGAAAAAG